MAVAITKQEVMKFYSNNHMCTIPKASNGDQLARKRKKQDILQDDKLEPYPREELLEGVDMPSRIIKRRRITHDIKVLNKKKTSRKHQGCKNRGSTEYELLLDELKEIEEDCALMNMKKRSRTSVSDGLNIKGLRSAEDKVREYEYKSSSCPPSSVINDEGYRAERCKNGLKKVRIAIILLCFCFYVQGVWERTTENNH